MNLSPLPPPSLSLLCLLSSPLSLSLSLSHTLSHSLSLSLSLSLSPSLPPSLSPLSVCLSISPVSVFVYLSSDAIHMVELFIAWHPCFNFSIKSNSNGTEDSTEETPKTARRLIQLPFSTNNKVIWAMLGLSGDNYILLPNNNKMDYPQSFIVFNILTYIRET